MTRNLTKEAILSISPEASPLPPRPGHQRGPSSPRSFFAAVWRIFRALSLCFRAPEVLSNRGWLKESGGVAVLVQARSDVNGWRKMANVRRLLSRRVYNLRATKRKLSLVLPVAFPFSRRQKSLLSMFLYEIQTWVLWRKKRTKNLV